jgi:hypothetical protein
MATYEMRSAAADTPLLRTVLKCLANALIAGQAQIVIAAEIKQGTAINFQFTPLGRGNNTSPPIQACCLTYPQAFFDIAEIGQGLVSIELIDGSMNDFEQAL